MSGLDFSDLSDDQIVELAAGLAREALARNPAVAAALSQALLSEKEKADAALAGARMGRARQRQQIEDIHRRAAQEQAREEMRQKNLAALGVLVKRAASIVGRELQDVTLVWMTDQHRGAQLLLNPGTNAEQIGVAHLVDFLPKTERLRTSWALDSRKPAILLWAREAAAALRAMGVSHITARGIEL